MTRLVECVANALGFRKVNVLWWLDPNGKTWHLDSIWPDGKGHERVQAMRPYQVLVSERRWLQLRP
jgi:hypothetical protein